MKPVFLSKCGLIEVNGVKLNVYDSGAERSYETSVALIFLHGFPGKLSNWKYQVPYFEEKLRVIAYDQRGFGESDKPRRVSFDDYVSDLAALLEKLGVNSGDAVLVGHSFGGMVAQLFARDREVKGLVLIGSLTKIRADFTDYVIQYTPSFIWKPLFFTRNFLTDRLYPQLYFSPSTPIKVWEEFAEDNVDYLQRLPAHVYRYHKYFADYDAEKWLNKVETPALVVVGEDDKIAPPQESEKISRLMPNAELKVVKAVGHMVLYEKPEELNNIIDEFLAKIGAYKSFPE